MKRFKSVFAVALLLSVFAISASAFSPPNGNCVGVNSAGIGWICADAVKAAGNDPIEAIMIGVDFWYGVTLSGNYYVANCNSKLITGEKIDMCFRTKSGKYIPFCLQARYRFTGGEVVDNGIGGQNLRVKVSP